LDEENPTYAAAGLAQENDLAQHNCAGCRGW